MVWSGLVIQLQDVRCACHSNKMHYGPKLFASKNSCFGIYILCSHEKTKGITSKVLDACKTQCGILNGCSGYMLKLLNPTKVPWVSSHGRASKEFVDTNLFCEFMWQNRSVKSIKGVVYKKFNFFHLLNNCHLKPNNIGYKTIPQNIFCVLKDVFLVLWWIYDVITTVYFGVNYPFKTRRSGFFGTRKFFSWFEVNLLQFCSWHLYAYCMCLPLTLSADLWGPEVRCK